MYSPEMRRRAGQGRGNDRELLHMLTMDTGKSQKGHGGHQENIQLPETEGKLRLGFPPKHPNTSEISGGAEPRPLQLLVKDPGRKKPGVGKFFRGGGQDFSSIL